MDKEDFEVQELLETFETPEAQIRDTLADQNVIANPKRQQSGKRCARRTHNWNKANRPKFGPENEWETEPRGKTQRTAEERRRYLWTGTF
jgi:hypothetical protein